MIDLDDWSHRHDHIIWEKHPAVGDGQTPCVAGFPKKYMLGGRSQLHPEKKYSSPRLDDVQEAATAIKKNGSGSIPNFRQVLSREWGNDP
jgi:hypothetical protein